MVASPEGVSLRFSPQPSVFLCLSSPHTAGQPAGSLRLRVCVCVCLLLTVMVGCDDSAVNLSV